MKTNENLGTAGPLKNTTKLSSACPALSIVEGSNGFVVILLIYYPALFLKKSLFQFPEHPSPASAIKIFSSNLNITHRSSSVLIQCQSVSKNKDSLDTQPNTMYNTYQTNVVDPHS